MCGECNWPMKEQYQIRIEKIPGVVRFENNSNCNVFVSQISKPPKRKVFDILVIPPKSFKILEIGKEHELDMGSFYFRFETKKHKGE